MNKTITSATDFGQLFRETRRKEPDWLLDIRNRSMEKFLALGFPPPRHEDWRYTSLQAFLSTRFRPLEKLPEIDASVIKNSLEGIKALATLVFVDGVFDERLSARNGLPSGLTVKTLGEAIRENRPDLRTLLEYRPDAPDEVFASLNGAMAGDGAWIETEPGTILEEPVVICMINSDAAQPLASHLRHVIRAAEKSRLTLLEVYISRTEEISFANDMTRVFVDSGARVKHHIIKKGGDALQSVHTLAFRQEADSHFESHAALFQGSMTRHNIVAELAGSGSDALLNALCIPRGTQQTDMNLRMGHLAPHCDSRQICKSIVNDQASAAFCGRIVVSPGAQKTDAKQTIRSLLLSDSAKSYAKPQLEIYADDVKCTHGATTGDLDPDALFYLRSRGISIRDARAMLIYAFARESLSVISTSSIREILEKMLMERLLHDEGKTK